MQRLNAEGHIYHRHCFRCSRCNAALQSKSYEYDIHDDKFYCRTHFREVTRQKSIRRTLEARGISSFDENDLPSKGGDDKKPEDDWDIIHTPPATKTESPPPGEELDQKKHDDQLKRELPSLLSALAQKKRQDILNKEPPTQERPHPLPSIDEKKEKVALLPGKKLEEQETQVAEERNDKERRPPDANTNQANGHHKNPKSPKIGHKAGHSPKLPPVRPPPPSVPYTPPESRAPPKPGRNVTNKVLKTKMLEHYEFGQQYYEENGEAKEIIQERYEMANTGKNKTNEGEEPECQPYEVPKTKNRSKTEVQVAATPSKPSRHKNIPGFVAIHKGDTWARPYAVTALESGSSQSTGDGKHEQNKPARPKIKPARPAPPLPYGVKSKNRNAVQKSVSPYAVSDVKGVTKSANSK